MSSSEQVLLDNQRPARQVAGRTLSHRAASFVVIGYGNELRGDDAVGPYVARIVRSWCLPSVQALAVHQLVPELAEVVSGVDCAIFVDACVPNNTRETIQVRTIELTRVPISSAHSGDPRTLLVLAEALYSHYPQTWWITIPATHFEFGADLSAETWAGATAALDWIRTSIRRAGSCTK